MNEEFVLFCVFNELNKEVEETNTRKEKIKTVFLCKNPNPLVEILQLGKIS